MTGYPVVDLAEVLDFREGPGILAVDFHDSGVPLIRLAGLKQGASILSGCDYLDPGKVAQKWSHFRLDLGDVLLSTSASLGEVAVVGRDGVGAVPYTGIIRFRPSDDRVEATFIEHMLRSSYFAQQIAAMGVGSVMKHFGPSHLRQMRVPLPPLDAQRAIAEVLGALDDKIAANAILGTTAVGLADAIFTDAVRDVASGGQSFGDVASVQGGGTPRTKVEEYWNGDIRWATPTDVTALTLPYLESTSRLITEEGLRACSSALYPPGSILMTSRATIGAFAVAQHPTAVNQGFIVVNAHDPSQQWWLFHEMRSRVPDFLSHANGATFLELSRGKFKQLGVRLGSTNQMSAFGERVAGLHGRARAASQESAALAATRDTLLPGLMSGKIRVKDAERVVEEVV